MKVAWPSWPCGQVLKAKHKLRVAHVTLGLEMGGQEKLLVEFARHADRSRFELHFIVLGKHGPLADAIEDEGWSVQSLDTRDGLRPGLIVRLARLFRGFDVVHTHDDKPLLYGAPAARLARTPAIVHTHHHGKLAQVSRRQEFLTSLASRCVHRFACVSEDSARYLADAGVPENKVVVVHNGIDLSRFCYAGPNASGPAVTVARLSPVKGIDVLIDAAALLARRIPDFRLQIAGDGPCFHPLRQQVRGLGLESTVELLGEVKDVAGLLSRSRLFVLPSFSEGISLTLLEAMACGLPVVATRVGGVPEVAVDHETGLLVPSHDASALACAIEKLWSDHERLRVMGLNGRRRAQKCFDIRRMVARYEELYLEPLAESGFARHEVREAPCTL